MALSCECLASAETIGIFELASELASKRSRPGSALDVRDCTYGGEA